MARRILIRQNGLEGVSYAPNGYNFIGYFGNTFSSINQFTISPIPQIYTAGSGLSLSGNTFSVSVSNSNKIIYVSTTGNNSNNGLSELSPVLNLWRARDLASSGDTIVVLPGDYIFDNRNSAGCPYNGLVQSKVNLWKNGVTYHFMPGAKIYSYGSTSGSYSPYSDNMVFFQPNSLTFSECRVTGYLEFYANSEGADNNGANSAIFWGIEENGSGTYPGFNFKMQAKHIEGVTGCTVISSTRTVSGGSDISIILDIDTIKYGYYTGQSWNGCFMDIRGGDGYEMLVDIKVREIIGGGGSYYPVFNIRPRSSSGTNKLRIAIDVDYASMLGYSYLIAQTNVSGGSISSGQLTFNCNNCIFSSSLFWFVSTLRNYYVTITGNYYCSGTVTGRYGTGEYPFLNIWDQTNDGGSDNSIIDFKGNYYANHPTRTMVHVGGNGGGLPYGTTNHIGNITGDIYFNLPSANYTGTLFFLDMGKLRFSGRIHGKSNYSGYGFNGSVLKFNNHTGEAVISNAYIHSDLDSSLVAYGSPVSGLASFVLSNSYIDMTGTSSVVADLRNVNSYIQNSTLRNRGTSVLLSNSLSTGSLQIINSTLINSSTASTISYPLGTVTSAGAFSNKEIITSILNGTVSVVSGLI